MKFIFDEKIETVKIADLRESVGWNRMDEQLQDPKMHNLFEIGCFADERLVGYLCVVSNGVTDAYIQDVMVAPEYQGRGIGSEMMHLAIDKIKSLNIYMISVIYGDESLRGFYEKFGFYTMLCGQMLTEKQE